MLQRLNYELRKDLDDKSRSIDQLKSKIQEIERANKELTKQLQRHQDMLSRSFSTFDVSFVYFFFLLFFMLSLFFFFLGPVLEGT